MEHQNDKTSLIKQFGPMLNFFRVPFESGYRVDYRVDIGVESEILKFGKRKTGSIVARVIDRSILIRKKSSQDQP